MPDARRPLLAVDGDNFAHRSYHALPKSIGAQEVAAPVPLSVSPNFLLRLYESERPRAVLVGWDTLGAPTYRQTLFPAYQGSREFDDELVEQLDVIPEFVVACGFASAKAPGYEADDFLAATAAAKTRRKGQTLVASGDRDAFQLASDYVTILHRVKAGQMARIGPDEVRERYGVQPSPVPDFIALRGDPSDKLPGAKGVGAKGAAALLIKYATLEDAISDGRFPLQASELRLYRRIAAMDAIAPLPLLHDQMPNWGRAATLVRSWALNHLADRLEEYAAAGTQIN
jgi:5'-3' exonuclease